MPKLWSSPTTTQAQRKEIIRQVIHQIRVDVQGQSEQVQVMVGWIGGTVTHAQIIRPVAKWTQLSNYPQLCQRLKELAQMQLSGEEITNCLIQEGFYPPKRINVLNPGEVLVLMRQLGLGSCYANKTKDLLSEHEWWLPDLANRLEMPMVTLYNWVRRGWVRARQQPHAPRHWIIWADDSELERLKLHRQRPAGEVQKQLWRGEVPSIAMPPTDTDPS